MNLYTIESLLITIGEFFRGLHFKYQLIIAMGLFLAITWPYAVTCWKSIFGKKIGE
ncbi:MAG: hypothetical protein KGZ42_07300 [Melioribacter sp.]|nr:hypothetical protein [Melioribacter sp.]